MRIAILKLWKIQKGEIKDDAGLSFSEPRNSELCKAKKTSDLWPAEFFILEMHSMELGISDSFKILIPMGLTQTRKLSSPAPPGGKRIDRPSKSLISMTCLWAILGPTSCRRIKWPLMEAFCCQKVAGQLANFQGQGQQLWESEL